MARSSRALALVVLTLALIPGPASAAKFFFEDKALRPLTQIARRHAMYAAGDVPSGSGAGELSIDLTFSTKDHESTTAHEDHASTTAHVIFFHHDELENVQKADKDQTFCCTVKVEGKGYGCAKDGEFLPTYTPLYKAELDVLPDRPEKLNKTVSVKKTGMHYLMFSHCDPGTDVIFINGENGWRNAYGYLPGELYYNLPFFLAMSILYAVAVLVWWGLVLYFRSDGVLSVQYHIGVVALLALFEVVLWYVYYQVYNETGLRGMGLLTTAVISSTIRKTSGRILILVVCMGYGVVKPTLGDTAMKVIAFGGLYCVFTTVLDVVKALSHEDDISGGFFILVIVPVALLDSIFYYWAFVSLYDVVAQLEERKQTMKLSLYRKFLAVVAVCLLLSLAWVLFQMYFLWSNTMDEHWQYLWVFDAYWNVLTFVVLLTIMVLWKPSSSSMNYAYHEQLSGVDDNLESIELDDHSAAFSIDDDDDEPEFDKHDHHLTQLDSELTEGPDSADDI